MDLSSLFEPGVNHGKRKDNRALLQDVISTMITLLIE
jgi:hypothetical protein